MDQPSSIPENNYLSNRRRKMLLTYRNGFLRVISVDNSTWNGEGCSQRSCIQQSLLRSRCGQLLRALNKHPFNSNSSREYILTYGNVQFDFLLALIREIVIIRIGPSSSSLKAIGWYINRQKNFYVTTNPFLIILRLGQLLAVTCNWFII